MSDPMPIHQLSPYFEPGKLAGLERMRFTTQRRVEGAYSGRHRAKRTGGSGEFVDYREYTPGDDLRRLDWQVMGRTDRAYLKMYQEETDLLCTLAIDVSNSMLQGVKGQGTTSGSKLEWAQYFATALSHLILLGRDSVGLALLNDAVTGYWPPSSALTYRGVIHDAIAKLKPYGQSCLRQSLDDLLLRVKRRGVLLLLSDFLVEDFEGLLSGLRKFRARGWEIVTLHVTHPDEEELPKGIAYRFVDWESRAFVNCQLTDVRQEYLARFQSHLNKTRTGLHSIGCDYVLTSTRAPYLDVLRAFLVRRSS